MEYSEILKEMEDKYEELSGFCPGDGSDAGIRLRVLAGELHNLWTQMEWLERQIFPDTATGQWLEKLAEQKGLQRKAGARASGTLTFLRESPLWYDITIPKGTRCAVSRESGVSYETLEEVVLPSGSLSVDAAAQAMSIGVEGNSPADTITVMLTPPAGISSVTNGTAFTGGVEEEDDESLRERLLEAYHRPSNGVNSGFYEQEALKHDQVYSVSVVPRARGNGTVDIYISTLQGDPSTQLLEELQEEFNLQKEINVDIQVKAPERVEVEIVAYVKTVEGYDRNAVVKECKERIQECFSKKKIGENLYLAQIGDVIFHTPGVENYLFETDLSSDTTVDRTSLVKLKSCTLPEMEV